MLQFLFCLFGLHGVTEISNGKKEYRDCLKEIDASWKYKIILTLGLLLLSYNCIFGNHW